MLRVSNNHCNFILQQHEVVRRNYVNEKIEEQGCVVICGSSLLEIVIELVA